MPDRTVEDRLREEYFELLPYIRRVLGHLEAEIRYRLLPVSRGLGHFERLEIKSRAKACESAIDSLRRRQQGAIFYPDASYTLTSLKDLAGVRVLVFPRGRMSEVDRILREAEAYRDWAADPVRDGEKVLALKYSGYCTAASTRIVGEFQIAPILTDLFWNVEHAAIYKPSFDLRDEVQTETMQQRTRNVLEALSAFEDEFERQVGQK